MTFYYVDTSALLKLVHVEVGSPEMRALFKPGDLWLSADITRTEVPRALARLDPGTPPAQRARVLDGIALIALDSTLLDLAGRLQPPVLRSLDAIHVVAALSLGADLAALITYDRRLAEAATLNGLAVLSPGVDLTTS